MARDQGYRAIPRGLSGEGRLAGSRPSGAELFLRLISLSSLTRGLTRGRAMSQDDLSKIYPQLMSDVNILLIELQARRLRPALLASSSKALKQQGFGALGTTVAGAGARGLDAVLRA